MSERRDPARAAAALIALAHSIDGGDSVRDEPASVFAPLAPDDDAPADEGPEKR